MRRPDAHNADCARAVGLANFAAYLRARVVLLAEFGRLIRATSFPIERTGFPAGVALTLSAPRIPPNAHNGLPPHARPLCTGGAGSVARSRPRVAPQHAEDGARRARRRRQRRPRPLPARRVGEAQARRGGRARGRDRRRPDGLLVGRRRERDTCDGRAHFEVGGWMLESGGSGWRFFGYARAMRAPGECVLAHSACVLRADVL